MADPSWVLQDGAVGYHTPTPYTTFQKPKVGLAVVCRCENNLVQCLLQKRGQNSASPNKWSFPGGRLEQPGDLDDEGSVGTKRELEEECGGGVPPGLPPLIHIECCKSGKQKQTLYHVYVVDTSADKDWEKWEPKSKEGRSSEVDTTPTQLHVSNQSFPCVNGYCWVDLSALISDCWELHQQSDLLESQLQHGLIRWVQNYGEHVLKTLIARSPKLSHPRRHSTSSSSSSSNGTSHSHAHTPRPRPNLTGGKPRRYPVIPRGINTMGGMLQPPFFPGFFRPPFQPLGSPTNLYYGIGLSPSQLSPPGGGGVTTVSSPSVGIPIPNVSLSRPGGHQGMVYPQPTIPMQQQMMAGRVSPRQFGRQDAAERQSTSPSPSIPHPPSTTSFVPISAESSTSDLLQGPVPVLVPGAQNGGAGNIHAGLGAVPASAMLTSGQLSGGRGFEHAGILGAMGSLPQPPGTTVGMFPEQLTSVASQFPNQPAPAVVTGRGESEPLLPNPPTAHSSLAPFNSSSPSPSSLHPGHQHHGSVPYRKETLCRHFVAGNCPYGEKCWFAHPEPFMSSPFQQRDLAALSMLPPTSIPSSPLHIQVPHTLWMNNPTAPIDFANLAAASSQYTPSPPQSPINSPLLPILVGASTRPSILPRVRGVSPYQNFSGPQQQPLLYIRHPVMATSATASRLPGGMPLLPLGPFSPVAQVPLVAPTDPVLRFNLLSEVVLRFHELTEETMGGLFADISHLATHADHFYVSFGVNLHDYKILFGGYRSYQDNSVLVEQQSFMSAITCLHCSRVQPSLLVIGTETGAVYAWDHRRGMSVGDPVPVYIPEQPLTPVTALIHFMTSINAAQVVVAGTSTGTVSWYISQPPQKTFSLLYSNHFHLPSPIVALQILGGILITGSKNGQVKLWSMQSQQPTIDSSFSAHVVSLKDIHALDSTFFLTVGIGPNALWQEESGGHVTSRDLPPPPSGEVASQGPGGQQQIQVAHQQAMDSVATDLAQLAISKEGIPLHQVADPLNSCHAILWQFGKPPQKVKVISKLGDVVSTAFHFHGIVNSMFLAVGMREGTVKIYNLPNFTVASELHFSEMKGKDCLHVALNLSREVPLPNHAYVRNLFRDLILTTVWSGGKIMVCQVARQ